MKFNKSKRTIRHNLSIKYRYKLMALSNTERRKKALTLLNDTNYRLPDDISDNDRYKIALLIDLVPSGTVPIESIRHSIAATPSRIPSPRALELVSRSRPMPRSPSRSRSRSRNQAGGRKRKTRRR